jgi:glyoxylase-like metal-dependent hydrolase (beta-lactamase superfamily II)
MIHKIHPLAICKSFSKRSSVYYLNTSEERRWAFTYAWLIEGPKQTILVDTGCDAEDMKRAEGRGIIWENILSFEQSLKKYGLTPRDIDIVIITHLHPDHCLNSPKCTRAKLIVQQQELKFALKPHPLFARNYNQSLLQKLDYQVVKGSYQVCDGIEVFLTPGHTVGTQSVRINTEKGETIITGFCCDKENFFPEGSTGVTIMTIHSNPFQAYQSMMKIKRGKAIIIYNHDTMYGGMETIP